MSILYSDATKATLGEAEDDVPGRRLLPVQELDALLYRFVVGQIAETAVGERREARVVRHLLVRRAGWGRVSPVEHHPDEIPVLLLGRIVADVVPRR